jgi:predicted TIM-barrel fold metal-dependent hydrolase
MAERTIDTTMSMDDLLAMVPRPEERILPEPRPEPEPRPQKYTLVSVDDHLMEPPHLFEGRLPKKFQERAPRVIEEANGGQAWQFEDQVFPITGADATLTWSGAGYFGQVRFDEVRPAMYDPKARLVDMDIAGIEASLCFPSNLFGFAGKRFLGMKDRQLGLAAMRAYNDWIIDEWCGADPDRFIPCQVAWLHDVEIASSEIRANAARGFKAVAFSENPEKLGLPSLHTGYWDPFVAACAETGTVINLHVGSSSTTLRPSSDSPRQVMSKLFTMNAIMAVLDWLYGGFTVRFPEVKIAMSESGIGWIPWLLDRIAYHENSDIREQRSQATTDVSYEELLMRNFWFATFYDARGFQMLDHIDPSRVLCETDYPHSDSAWPDCQAVLDAQVGHLPADIIRMVTYQNACELYNHPLPRSVRAGGAAR